MRILLLGSGGREHALAWKLKQSPRCEALFIAPGNGGTGDLGVNLPLDPNDPAAVKTAIQEHDVDMLVVGPEAPLVAGLVDALKADKALDGLHIIGPSQRGARLEGSKAFAKKFMQDRHIPTAAFREFTAASLEDGLEYLASVTPPIVLKADGLAAGKGVLILDNVEEAQTEFRAMLDGKFGAASARVVVEEFLSGIEFSVFAVTDGHSYKVLPVAKDYKRIGEGDTGLNTGGMGSVSPVPFVDYVLMRKVEDRIIRPTIKGLHDEGIDYTGFVFFGLIVVRGDPYVIEYNCRMGDPETQSVLPRLDNDLVDIFEAMCSGRLKEVDIRKSEQAAATVILVSGGYPEHYEKGKPIAGLEGVRDCLVFHAGTRKEDGRLLTNGGRVLALTARANDYREALLIANREAARVAFEGKYFRGDIGFDL